MILYKPKSSYWSTKSIHDILILINEHFRSILQDIVKVETNIILKRLFYWINFYIRCYCSYHNYINNFVKPQKLYWRYIYIELKIKCLYFQNWTFFWCLATQPSMLSNFFLLKPSLTVLRPTLKLLIFTFLMHSALSHMQSLTAYFSWKTFLHFKKY